MRRIKTPGQEIMVFLIKLSYGVVVTIGASLAAAVFFAPPRSRCFLSICLFSKNSLHTTTTLKLKNEPAIRHAIHVGAKMPAKTISPTTPKPKMPLHPNSESCVDGFCIIHSRITPIFCVSGAQTRPDKSRWGMLAVNVIRAVKYVTRSSFGDIKSRLRVVSPCRMPQGIVQQRAT